MSATPLSQALRAVLAAGVRGFAVLGVGGPRPRVLLDAAEGYRGEVIRTPRAAEALLAHLTPPPSGERVFLLGYEAAVALEWPEMTHGVNPRLGPDGWVRDYTSGLALAEGEPQPFGSGPQLEAVVRQLGQGPPLPPPPTLTLEVQEGERARHEERVRRCREALLDGVLYQANLAHPLEVGPQSLPEAVAFFVARTEARPPAYAALVDDERWGTLVSLSPECFLRWDLPAKTAAAWPIKGTRPRGKTPAEDRALLDELQRSEKDAAEHVMIVDLLRNDLGRVARVGGVTVTELMRTVSVENVHHLETEVVADLRPDVGLPELLRATAPGGSITGAPKSTAVEVIAQLEAGPRGPYTGNLGVIDADGRGEASILIRTWIRPHEGPGTLHVGGGIVVQSDPAEEWEETLAKARAFGTVG